MKIKMEEFSISCDELLNEFLHTSFEIRQEALQAGAEVLKARLIPASPVDTGNFAGNWEIKTKYKDRRYVGNSTTVPYKGKDVPLSNILENHAPTAGFMRRAYDACESEIYNTIKNKLKGG